eukprot:3967946-Amphidinium_carterae.1
MEKIIAVWFELHVLQRLVANLDFSFGMAYHTQKQGFDPGIPSPFLHEGSYGMHCEAEQGSTCLCGERVVSVLHSSSEGPYQGISQLGGPRRVATLTTCLDMGETERVSSAVHDSVCRREFT